MSVPIRSLPTSSMNTKTGKTSYAAASNFRGDTLILSNVTIEQPGVTVPPNPARLIAYLAHWPPAYNAIIETTNEIQGLADDEQRELRAALDAARFVSNDAIARCTDRVEIEWMYSVNLKMLNNLIEERSADTLTSTVGETWRQGPNDRGLYNPTPDYAFGLGFEATPPLRLRELNHIFTSPTLRVAYSPSGTKIVFPALIYEAKSDSQPIKYAENQAAVGVARALDLLAGLSRESPISYQHCVTAVVSAGSAWKVLVGYHDLDEERQVHLVPVFEESLQIRLFHDRVRLSYILNRILRWMKGDYRAQVAQQVNSLLPHAGGPLAAHQEQAEPQPDP